MGYSAKPQGMPGWGARQIVNAPGMGQTPNKLPPGSQFGTQFGQGFTGAKPGMSSGFGGMPAPVGGLYGMNNKPSATQGFGQMPQAPGGLQAPPMQAPQVPQPFDSPMGQRQQPNPYAGMSGSDIFARMFSPNQQLARAMER